MKAIDLIDLFEHPYRKLEPTVQPLEDERLQSGPLVSETSINGVLVENVAAENEEVLVGKM